MIILNNIRFYCPICGSSNTQLLDIIIDVRRPEGTLPIWKCVSCSTTFDGRSKELENYYSAHGYMPSNQQLLETVVQEIIKGGPVSDNLKYYLLNNLTGEGLGIDSYTGKLSVSEDKIKEIIDRHLTKLRDKISYLYEESMISLKTKINQFQLKE